MKKFVVKYNGVQVTYEAATAELAMTQFISEYGIMHERKLKYIKVDEVNG